MIAPETRVAVVGGSIGGLCAGNVLRLLGADVDVYESSSHRLSSRGAGIVVQPELVELIRRVRGEPLATTRCSVRRSFAGRTGRVREQSMPQDFTSWEAIFESLMSAFPEDRYHLGCRVSDPWADSDSARFTVGGRQAVVDLLVAADGFRSGMRRTFAPKSPRSYAGYIAWRGVVAEKDLSDRLVGSFDDAFSFCALPDGGHALAYFIPGDGLSTEPGERRLNWVWYVTVPEGERLDAYLTDRSGERHEAAVPPGLIDPRSVESLHLASSGLDPRFEELILATRDPFIQLIVDVAPERMVSGRACLLGDAAFVVRPHTAGASAKAAGDALALGASLEGSPGDVVAALADWEVERLAYGKQLMQYGIRLGNQSTARHGA